MNSAWVVVVCIAAMHGGEGTSFEPSRPPALANHPTAVLVAHAAGGGVVGALEAGRAARDLASFGGRPTGYLPHLKGELAEGVVADLVVGGVLEQAGWTKITPARHGRAGIDALYVKIGSDGRIKDLLVGETKFGSSWLGRSAQGPQASRAWTSARLEQTARLYRSAAADVASSALRRVTRLTYVPPNAVEIRLAGGERALIWRNGVGTAYLWTSHSGVTEAQVASQARRVGEYLEGCARGAVSYRTRLFHYEVAGTEHKFTVYEVADRAGAATVPVAKVIREFKGEYPQLPRPFQRALKDRVLQRFVEAGLPRARATELAEEYCVHPEKTLPYLVYRPRWSPWLGINSRMLLSTGGGATMGAAIEAALEFREGGIDWRRVARAGGSSGMAMAAAHYAGAQADYIIVSTSIGRNLSSAAGLPAGLARTLAGAAAGGLAASLAYPAAAYVSGYMDQDSALRLAGRGAIGYVAGVGACAALTWAVGTFGYASTGTAIASLHGVAAQNAILAWLGGGSLAAGGGGVAVGSAVVFGVVVVVPGVIWVGWQIWDMFAEASERTTILLYRIDLLEKQLSAAK